MKTESTIKPPVTSKFLIEQTGNGKCNVHFYENLEQRTTENGDTLYSFDWYVLEGITYHDNLESNIKAQTGKWLEMAKEKEYGQPLTPEMQIQALKNELAAYDYIGVKLAMGVATREEYAEEIAHTETLRQRIRTLESEVG